MSHQVVQESSPSTVVQSWPTGSLVGLPSTQIHLAAPTVQNNLRPSFSTGLPILTTPQMFMQAAPTLPVAYPKAPIQWLASSCTQLQQANNGGIPLVRAEQLAATPTAVLSPAQPVHSVMTSGYRVHAVHQVISPPWLPNVLPTGSHVFDASGVPTALTVDLHPTDRFHFKRARDCTKPLKEWLIANKHNPYPSKRDKYYLVMVSGLSVNQVSMWFANARRRIKKVGMRTWSKGACDSETLSSSSTEPLEQHDNDEETSQQTRSPHKELQDPGATTVSPCRRMRTGMDGHFQNNEKQARQETPSSAPYYNYPSTRHSGTIAHAHAVWDIRSKQGRPGDEEPEEEESDIDVTSSPLKESERDL